MKKKILALLVGLLLLVSCSFEEEALPLTTTTALQPTPTYTIPPVSTSSLDSDAEKIQLPSPIRSQATNVPWRYALGANKDGSWYFEFNANNLMTLQIYQKDNPLPIIDQDLYEYYPGYPNTSYPEFQTHNSPGQAGTSEPVWSPNGQYLAFLGAIEGPSSDLYVFDTVSQIITRLTSGENQAVYPEWSPDSEWIIHGEMVDPRGSGGYKSLWAARVDGSEVRWLYSPKDGWPHILGWIDQSSFYTYDGTWCANVALRLVNLAADKVSIAFDVNPFCGGVMSFQFDPKSGAVVYLFSIEDHLTEYEPWAIYLTTPWAPSPRLMLPDNLDATKKVYDWDEESGLYIAYSGCNDSEDLFHAFNPQGEVFCVEYAP